MSARTGAVTPYSAPRTGQSVDDPERGRGVVVRTLIGGAVWVSFGAGDPVMYTHRRALNRWVAFPGPAGAPGLDA